MADRAESAFYTRDSGTKPQSYEGVDIPEELGPIRIEVTEELIKQYAFCLDDYRAWHFSESPFGGPVGHAALLSNDLLTVYCAIYDRHDGVAMHTDEELTFYAPVPVGEVVTISGRYVDKYVRRGLGVVVMEAEARDSTGKLLISHRGKEVTSIRPGDFAGRGSSEPTTDRIKLEALDVTPIEKPPVEFALGRPIRGATKKLSQAQMAVFSFIGENELNFHNDLGMATSKGLKGTIAQGLQTVGFFSEVCTDFFGADWFTSGRIKAKFVNPVYANSLITISGKVAGQGSFEDGCATTRLELWAQDQDQRLLSVAWASATTEIG